MKAYYENLRGSKSALSSLENILDVLEQRELIDPSRVGITGLSNGAQQAHFAIINTDRISAASVSTLVTPELWYFMEPPVMRAHMRSWWSGAPSCDLESYRARSYRCNVERVRTPILANISDQESILTLQELAALQDAGKPIEMYIFPDEYHNKWQPQHRLAIYIRNLDWFRFWLQGYESAEPGKVEQYARWREMREKQCDCLKGDDAPWYCRPGALEEAGALK